MNTDLAFQAFVRADNIVDTVSAFNLLTGSCAGFAPGDDTYEALKKHTDTEATGAALWKILDAKQRSCMLYMKQCCAEQKVLIIGAGPAGLRAAIELALLGAKVVLVDKDMSFWRQNVLKIWPFTMEDCISLGAGFFYNKFCKADHTHISIREMQVILLKLALILGVRFEYGVAFHGFVPPPEMGSAWSAHLSSPDGHMLADIKFDLCIGADGENSFVGQAAGFSTKVFSAPYTQIGVTFNFKNNNTPEENELSDFSCVYQLTRPFFQQLKEQHAMDVESLVYFNDESHNFTVTLTTGSLVQQKVFHKPKPTVAEMLVPTNVNMTGLETMAMKLASVAKLPGQLPMTKTMHGTNDIALWNFSTKSACTHPCKVFECNGKFVVVGVIGDALLAPFWQHGTSLNRAFLSALDVAHTATMLAALGSEPSEDGLVDMLKESQAVYNTMAIAYPSDIISGASGPSPMGRYTQWTGMTDTPELEEMAGGLLQQVSRDVAKSGDAQRILNAMSCMLPGGSEDVINDMTMLSALVDGMGITPTHPRVAQTTLVSTPAETLTQEIAVLQKILAEKQAALDELLKSKDAPAAAPARVGPTRGSMIILN